MFRSHVTPVDSSPPPAPPLPPQTIRLKSKTADPNVLIDLRFQQSCRSVSRTESWHPAPNGRYNTMRMTRIGR